MTRSGGNFLLIAALIAGALGTRASAAIDYIMYQDSFSRGSVGGEISVHNTAPDVWNTPSATWNAFPSTNFTNGTVLTNLSSSGWLPFTPVNGRVYRLSSDMDTIATSNEWDAIAFSADDNTTGFFGNPVGPWLLQRGDGTSTDSVFLGPDAANATAVTASGTQGWANYAILLDTTTAPWTASFYRNGALLHSQQYAVNPTINFIGFSSSGGGRLDNFTLAIPEPAAATTLAMAFVTLVWSRRSR